MTEGIHMISDVELEDLLLEEMGEDITYDNDQMELHGIPIHCEYIDEEEFYVQLVKRTSAGDFAKAVDKITSAKDEKGIFDALGICLLYTSPSPRDRG